MKKIRNINLMLGGIPPKKIDKSAYWIGVDSGAEYLLEKGINPQYIIGDLDSIDSNVINSYDGKIIKKLNQEMTDTEYAIYQINKLFPEVNEINIYGATGKRQDHFFANILLLSNRIFEDVSIKIIDDNNCIFVINKGNNKLNKNEMYKYVSFVPIRENTIISLKGSKYDVEDYELTLSRANATSNEFVCEEIIVTTNQKCLVIYSKDK